MNLRLILLFSLYILIVSSLSCQSIANAGNSALPLELNDDPVFWNRLSYRAKSIFGHVTTDVRLKSIKVEYGVELDVFDPVGDVLQPTGDSLFILTVDSNIKPLFGAAEAFKSQLWFNPGGGALQRNRLRLGKEKWQKRYWFTKKGVYRLRKKPKDSSERSLPIDQWTKVRNHFYEFGNAVQSCPQILDPASLLYISSTINLTTVPDHLILCVFNKKQLFRMNVMIKEHRRMRVNYIVKMGEHQIERDMKIETIRLSFEPRSLAADDTQPETFSFIGLKGKFEVYVDKATHLPVQISGKISTFGKIDIKLQEAQLTNQPLAQ